MKKILAIVLVMVLALVLVACGEEPAPNKDKIKVVYIVNGTLGDKSFFDSGKEGFDMINKDFGDKVETKIVELTYDKTKWETGTKDVVAEGYDIVIAGTWDMKGYIEELAPQYPETKFWFFDESWSFADGHNDANVYGMLFAQNEGSYIVGMAAAMTSKTGKVAFMGGMSNTVLKDFFVGYYEGAKSVNPDIEVKATWTDSFNDSTLGKTTATGLYQQGFDVVFSCCGACGLGAFDAVIEATDCYVIGVDGDQAAYFAANGAQDKADRTVTSMEKRVKNGFYDAMKRHLDGTLPYGTNEYLGLAKDCVAASTSTILTEEQVAKLDEAKAKIVSGEIKVGTAFDMSEEEYAKYENGTK